MNRTHTIPPTAHNVIMTLDESVCADELAEKLVGVPMVRIRRAVQMLYEQGRDEAAADLKYAANLSR